MSSEKKPIVLLIEPDAALRRLISLGLEHRGMQVIEANSPTRMPSFEALDLLVLDLDGSADRNRTFLSSAHALLARPQFSTLPTILLAWEYPASSGATQSAVDTAASNLFKTYVTEHLAPCHRRWPPPRLYWHDATIRRNSCRTSYSNCGITIMDT